MIEVNNANIKTFSPQKVDELVYEKLVRIAEKHPLILYEGYRPIEKQRKMFAAFKEQHPGMTDEECHNFIAIPERAVHCTGGAVDVALQGNEGGEYLNWDTCKTDLSNPTHKLLCDLMEQEGFWNFPNEWWHFEIRAITKGEKAAKSEKDTKNGKTTKGGK